MTPPAPRATANRSCKPTARSATPCCCASASGFPRSGRRMSDGRGVVVNPQCRSCERRDPCAVKVRFEAVAVGAFLSVTKACGYGPRVRGGDDSVLGGCPNLSLPIGSARVHPPPPLPKNPPFQALPNSPSPPPPPHPPPPPTPP